MRGKMIAAAAALLTTAGVAGAGVASAASPNIPTATPLHFARGATSTDVRGHVGAGGDRRYTFQARAGQTATFHLARSTSAMTWTLVGPTGPSVHDAHSPRQSDFTYTLPESGTYYVDIVSSRAATYDLSLSIPATTGGSSSTIAFPAGGTRATVEGTGSHSYTFGARAGQRATVHFTDSSAHGAWTLVAPDGSPLHTTMTEQQRDVTVQLPATGDHRLDVQAPAGSRYTLTLSIPRG
ncbi:peptidase [Kineococcus sp. TBRC 1896]|uniref:Peptidase n=1 Tax=Kineococcus mangrovi TaxID=1660183 RepID=A0ABV4I2B8_9ACTN